VELDPVTISFLTLIALFAGFVDSIAGGGGTVTLPALMAVGIPPHQALATNKLQSSFGSLTATLNYSRLGMMNIRDLLLGVVTTLMGALAGSIAVQRFRADSLQHLILLMLVVIFVYTLFSPRLGVEPSAGRVGDIPLYSGAGLAIGFYDGFFGPGTGSFWTMALVLGLGLDLKSATAQTKLFNFISNIVSLCIFVHAGLVLWMVGIAMGAGQMAGAYIGSTMVHRRDVRFVRIFFLIVVSATIFKLIFFG
jgi:uncharacterized membrane protein YfcA